MGEKKGLGIRDLPEGTIDTIVDAVTSEMPADAIIILGSYARSEATEESDIDILVPEDGDGQGCDGSWAKDVGVCPYLGTSCP